MSECKVHTERVCALRDVHAKLEIRMTAWLSVSDQTGSAVLRAAVHCMLRAGVMHIVSSVCGRM